MCLGGHRGSNILYLRVKHVMIMNEKKKSTAECASKHSTNHHSGRKCRCRCISLLMGERFLYLRSEWYSSPRFVIVKTSEGRKTSVFFVFVCFFCDWSLLFRRGEFNLFYCACEGSVYPNRGAVLLFSPPRVDELLLSLISALLFNFPSKR